MHGNKILLLKRSNQVKTYKGFWAGISGYVEKKEKPLETAIKEIGEETGLPPTDFKMIKRGKAIHFRSRYEGKVFHWIIHPFLFCTATKNIRIDWEHVDYKWVLPKDISKYRTVPKLKDAFLSIKKNGYQ
jgi:8-oxo-dGTP pyrophosphatase MutT (NUDIX family)